MLSAVQRDPVLFFHGNHCLKTMTSLRLRADLKLYIFKLKSLQLNRVKFSRKSYPRVGKAFVLNNPLYNLKICDYF